MFPPDIFPAAVVILPVTTVSPPMCAFSTTPNPPVLRRAPVVVLELPPEPVACTSVVPST